MKFNEAHEELIQTLVKGGMSEADAKRKMRNWTRRIEDRTVRYLRDKAIKDAAADRLRNN